MTNDHLETPKPDQEGNTAATKTGGNNITLDDMGIPILEEIVAPKKTQNPEPEVQGKSSSETLKRALTVPNNEILAKALRNQLISKVKKELDDITKDVASKAAASITPELEQIIRSQLTEILDRNLDEMIDKIMTEIPKRM